MQNKNNPLVSEYVLYRLFKINIDNVKRIKMASRSQNTFNRNFGVTTSFEISINTMLRRDCSIQNSILGFSISVQFRSTAQSCATLCDPMDCSMPGFPVHHQLTELAQTCVHRVGLILCPSVLLPPSIFPSSRVFSNESLLCIRWPNNDCSRLISFRIDWLDLLAVQGTFKSLLQHQGSKASILQHSAFFMVQL